MTLDIVDLRSFYDSPLGKATERFLGQVIRARFANCVGQSILGSVMPRPISKCSVATPCDCWPSCRRSKAW